MKSPVGATEIYEQDNELSFGFNQSKKSQKGNEGVWDNKDGTADDAPFCFRVFIILAIGKGSILVDDQTNDENMETLMLKGI